MKGLTARQRQILDFVQQYISMHQFSPSYREIAKHFGISSIGAVHKHLQVLKRKNALDFESGSSRSLFLPQMSQSSSSKEIELPFIGYVSSNQPLEMFPHSQTVFVPEFLVHDSKKTYVLRVRGDGFFEEGISQGDLLLIEGRNIVEGGETVLAQVKMQDMVIRRYSQEGEFIKLDGIHPLQKPLLLRERDVQVQGVLTGLLRFY